MRSAAHALCGRSAHVRLEWRFSRPSLTLPFLALAPRYLPYDVTMFDGSSGRSMHNEYPAVWADVVSNAIGDEDTDTLFFSRAGSLRSPAAGRNGGQFWAGDQNTQFDDNDGLKSALTSYLNAGHSGITMIHSDVGGYTSLDIEFPSEPPQRITVARTEELLLRWMEMSAAADCMFRSHEGNQADKQLQVWSTPELAAAFAYWAKFHMALAPLRKRLFDEAAEFGWPVVRAMWFDYGQDWFGVNEQCVRERQSHPGAPGAGAKGFTPGGVRGVPSRHSEICPLPP
jgi:alpha-glucosidase